MTNSDKPDLAARQAQMRHRNAMAIGRKATVCPSCGGKAEMCITGDYATIDCRASFGPNACNYSGEVPIRPRDARRLLARQKKMYQGR